MQDKMEKLLNQIGMSKDYLENSSINKIIVYDKNNLWEFIIDNDKVLPIYIYEELYLLSILQQFLLLIK